MKLQPFVLERYFAKYEFTTQYLLSSSDCESWLIHELLAFDPAAGEQLQKLWLGYGESSGGHALRSQISKLYTQVEPQDILVHTGAEEAIFLFMNAALEAGDEIVVHSPSYQALMEIPRSLGCKVVPWKSRPEQDWRVDLDDLRALVTAKTKVIAVNFPHNPTGYIPSQAEFAELASFADERGIILFSDEVYRESEHHESLRLTAACDLSENAVSLGVMSKSYGLAGLRIGWVSTRNPRILERMAELKDYTTICNSAPSEFLAELGLRFRSKLVSRNLEIIKANLDTLDNFFASHSDTLEWKRPKAGPIGFARLKKEEADGFCKRVVEGCGVMLLPGSVFGDFSSHFRVGYGRRNLPEAVAKLEAFLYR